MSSGQNVWEIVINIKYIIGIDQRCGENDIVFNYCDRRYFNFRFKYI